MINKINDFGLFSRYSVGFYICQLTRSLLVGEAFLILLNPLSNLILPFSLPPLSFSFAFVVALSLSLRKKSPPYDSYYCKKEEIKKEFEKHVQAKSDENNFVLDMYMNNLRLTNKDYFSNRVTPLNLFDDAYYRMSSDEASRQLNEVKVFPEYYVDNEHNITNTEIITPNLNQDIPSNKTLSLHESVNIDGKVVELLVDTGNESEFSLQVENLVTEENDTMVSYSFQNETYRKPYSKQYTRSFHEVKHYIMVKCNIVFRGVREEVDCLLHENQNLSNKINVSFLQRHHFVVDIFPSIQEKSSCGLRELIMVEDDKGKRTMSGFVDSGMGLSFMHVDTFKVKEDTNTVIYTQNQKQYETSYIRMNDRHEPILELEVIFAKEKRKVEVFLSNKMKDQFIIGKNLLEQNPCIINPNETYLLNQDMNPQEKESINNYYMEYKDDYICI